MKPARVVSVPVLLLATALVFPFVAALAMTKGLNHDENQHVAAGAMVARGLLPYRDFPHFHTPYLAFIYAALFHVTDHLLLAARLFGAACASAMAALVGSIGYALFRERGKRWAAGAGAGAVVLCLTAGLFGQTVGHAWNHEPSLLFALLAFVAHVAGIGRRRSGWLVASGVLLGVAIGTRLTFAPLVAPFGLALIFSGPSPRSMLSFAGGLLLGSVGLFVIFALAPEQTFFGTFEFAKVNVAYLDERAMTLPNKLGYLMKVIALREVALLAAAVLPLIAAYLAERRVRFEARFILLLLPFLLWGSLAPSPLHYQYFYPFVPFLILAGLYALASIPPESRWFSRALAAGVTAVALSAAVGSRVYLRLHDQLAVTGWTPLAVHRDALHLRAHVPAGRVLTFAPIFPLEAGLAIYPPFTTGLFAWRVSPQVEPGKAARLGMPTPATLAALLAAEPPAALLLGYESTESDFKEYAKSHAYQPEPLDGRTLWRAPEPPPSGVK